MSEHPVLLLCPGVPWRLHIWLASLRRAQQLGRDEATAFLLTEFPSIRTEDYTPELLSAGVPLLFRMLESSKVELKMLMVVSWSLLVKDVAPSGGGTFLTPLSCC